MSYASATLNNIADAAATGLANSETQIATGLSALNGDTTAAQLMALQAQLAINSTLTAAYSGMAKERSDCLKGCCQKFG
ncbi:MAG TPA: hypothetical protein VL593_13850 [Ramlibacter sp.]|jgi:hypothetical protein|nr:hypothetical protein [Ramlibacter sp.]